MYKCICNREFEKDRSYYNHIRYCKEYHNHQGTIPMDHPWSRKMLKLDEDGKSIKNKKSAKTQIESGTHHWLSKNLEYDENGYSISHKLGRETKLKIYGTKNTAFGFRKLTESGIELGITEDDVLKWNDYSMKIVRNNGISTSQSYEFSRGYMTEFVYKNNHTILKSTAEFLLAYYLSCSNIDWKYEKLTTKGNIKWYSNDFLIKVGNIDYVIETKDNLSRYDLSDQEYSVIKTGRRFIKLDKLLINKYCINKLNEYYKCILFKILNNLSHEKIFYFNFDKLKNYYRTFRD